MRLVILSNMSHYRRGGQIVGWGPAVEEIDHLAKLFTEIRLVGCLHPEPAPPSALPHPSSRVELVLVPAAGGPRWRDKLGILRWAPLYVRTILRELRHADAVHVRSPANVSLIAMILLALTRRPSRRWIKFGGNWRPQGAEAWSNTFQRWWLAHGPHRARVTVNGRWDGQPAHVVAFDNPCLTRDELARAREQAGGKRLAAPVRLLYAGRLETPKGLAQILETVASLARRSIPAHLDLVGDGPERPRFEALAEELEVADRVVFHGWKPRHELADDYARAHFFLLPSRTEGWPKVLGEAMAYGVVPIASAVASIPQILSECETGRALPDENAEAFADAIAAYFEAPDRWQAESAAGTRAADRFTYEHYLEQVRGLLLEDPAP